MFIQFIYDFYLFLIIFCSNIPGYNGPLHYSMIPGNPDTSTLPENRTMETDITTGSLSKIYHKIILLFYFNKFN